MKSQRPLNTDGSEVEALAKNVSYQEPALVERHRLDVRMGSQAAKSHAVRWLCRRIPDDGLPAVPGVAAIAVVIIVLVASHNSPADRSDKRGKCDTSATATAEGSHPDTRAFSQ